MCAAEVEHDEAGAKADALWKVGRRTLGTISSSSSTGSSTGSLSRSRSTTSQHGQPSVREAERHVLRGEPDRQRGRVVCACQDLCAPIREGGPWPSGAVTGDVVVLGTDAALDASRVHRLVKRQEMSLGSIGRVGGAHGRAAESHVVDAHA